MQKINELASKREPFLFVLSYDLKEQFIQPLNKLDSDILFKIGNQRNYPKTPLTKNYFLKKSPLSFESYKKSLEKVLEEIRSGNTYLLNLTFKTPIETDLNLKEIFTFAKAKYKLYFKDEFICFSPEKFIEIIDNEISTYPMKGTIEASIPNAKEKILANEKEMAEHVMIVDLMRNDLSMVGVNVQVEKFRYVEKIKAGEKELLQVSSKITATLPTDWNKTLGDLLQTLLPAGSITGTPKVSTVNIINKIENYERGFYTGVFGIFDGENLYAAVMIRFIEKENENLYYKSGGGITIDSDAKSEYEELIDKIYLPL
ncbi:MAG: Para-aminobenzoate synthase, aminase component (EC [uncultured Sulfurovum sp.]|uniref:Para-aminobenzoate synthase, aminase component (EC) n=1 Tax=uncultured Sulfurovum sp. TaxID=269237 RepID=A0A6S6S337_9BACT|nr:MAG: Para-aminobenzoate synthase, aminase component (EC [uncultured Sulfurovum sp.]